MKINLAVCGKFHLLNYVEELNSAGLLENFFFSYKRGTEFALAGDQKKYKNLFIKEYLTQGQARLLKGRLHDQTSILFGKVWAAQVAHVWTDADIFHFVSHGHCRKLVDRARRAAASSIAEVVNTHPENMLEVRRKELVRRGLGASELKITEREIRQLQESQLADFLLAPSAHVRRTYVERGFDASRIFVLPFGANLKRFNCEGARSASSAYSDKLRIICVGAVSLRKGQLYLLEALNKLNKSLFEVTLVGAMAPEIRPLIQDFDSFTHLPHVDNKNLQQLFNKNDVFCLPTFEEGMAVANLEAMAAGLCVLTTRESGADAVIDHGETGFFIEPGNTDQIAATLDYFQQNRGVVKAVGQQGAKKIMGQYSWATYAKRLTEIYLQVHTQASRAVS